MENEWEKVGEDQWHQTWRHKEHGERIINTELINYILTSRDTYWKEQLQNARIDWLRSEIEKLEGSENTFFNDWNEEKEKLDDGTSKEDAVTFIEKIIPLAKTCPFCGKVPVFTYSVGKRDTSGYIGHFTKREGCCDATGMGKTELFFCNKDQSENYGLWAKQMFWQIQKWNERTNNQALTSIITRYKEELLELDKTNGF